MLTTLETVNEKLKQHNRMVYSTQSQRHVAEQIDTLYWNTVNEENLQIDHRATVVKKAADLATPDGFQCLPKEWEDLGLYGDLNMSEEDKNQYRELRERLETLTAERERQYMRLVQYRQFKTLLQPFENAQENIQPNLVTRDGDLAKELDRTRMLLARVTGRIVEMPKARTGNQIGPASTNEQKLTNVMELT